MLFLPLLLWTLNNITTQNSIADGDHLDLRPVI